MQTEYGWKQLAQLSLVGNETVLDIGCGDGRITVELARLVPRGSVVGVDSSPEMIAAARGAHLPRQPNLSFELMDARELTFESKFDLVFSTSALHWVKDHRAVLKGIWRALKPGGKIHLAFAARGTLSGLTPIAEALTRNPRWHTKIGSVRNPFGLYGPEEYRKWLDEIGFVVERVDLIERDVMHKGRAAFEGWLRTIGMTYIQRIEPEDQQQYLDEIVDEYIKANPIDAQGWVHVQMTNLLVKASKP
jgi:trans-aconitate methyltransferase